MSDHEKPEIQMMPTRTGKGVGLIIPELLASGQPIVVVDHRCDLQRFYEQGNDA